MAWSNEHRVLRSWQKAFSRLGSRWPRRHQSARRRSFGSLYSRALRTETLEDRCMLSASLPQFTSIDWNGQQVEVAKDQWIVRLEDGSSLDRFTTNTLLGSLGSGVSLTGLNTSLAVLEAPGRSWATMQAWASQFGGSISIEPDFVGYADSVFPNDEVFVSEFEATEELDLFDGLWGLHNEGFQNVEPFDFPYDTQLRWSWNTQTKTGAFVSSGSIGTLDADIDAPEAWEITTGSRKNVVGVIDTGVDYTHPDLYLNIWVNQAEIPTSVKSQLIDVDGDDLFTFVDFNDSANAGIMVGGQLALFDWNNNGYIDGGDLLNDGDTTNDIWEDTIDGDGNNLLNDIVGWNFSGNNNDPLDNNPNGHGTHTAGTIGAIGNNDIGLAGVNWEVQLMPLKWLDANGSGLSSAAIGAVEYATAQRTQGGSNVVATNNSWRLFISSNNLEVAISRANDADILFVTSAGNSALDTNQYPQFPASYDLPNIISVAATDSNDNLAVFSNYGATTVDLAAPGVNILSTSPVIQRISGHFPFYEELSGTSMASPHVAGVAALLAAKNSAATAAQIKEAILSSVDPLTHLAGLMVSGGRLNAASALAAIPVGELYTVSTTVDESDGNYAAGDLSLREAIELVNAAPAGQYRIQFAPNLAGSTITLTYDGPDSGTAPDPLTLAQNVSIEGLGAQLISINGNNQTRVFQVNAGVNAAINDLTIKNGNGSTGGGFYTQGNLTLERVAVENSFGGIGGAIHLNGGTLNVSDSTLSNNNGGYGGGALAVSGGSATIVNSTISTNTAGSSGGGIYVFGGSLQLTNSTVTKNRGGIFGTFGSQTTLDNSIVAENDLNLGSANDISGSINVAASSYNLIGSGGSGGITNGVNGNIVLTSGQSAGLTALGYHGGPTKTHALTSTSQAIDKGSTANVPSGVATDQRGLDRIFDDPSTSNGSGGAVDIGAFEYGAPLIVSTLQDENDGNYAAGDLSLREALVLATVLPGHNIIRFDDDFVAKGPATITLTYDGPDGGTAPDPLSVNSNVSIEGPSASLLAISGGNLTQVLTVSSGVTATIRDLTIKRGFSSTGGGIFSQGNLTLERVAVDDNDATAGGGIFVTGGSLTVIDSTVSNNFGQYVAGGIYSTTAPVTIINSTISNNSGTYQGGGIYASTSGTLQLIQSTVTQNRSNLGGGLYGTQFVAKNSIVAENFLASGSTANDVAGSPNTSLSSYNLIGSGGSGGLSNGVNGNIVLTAGQTPGLGALADNGGPTKTHALSTTSAAIDKGSAANIPSGVTTDQRGFERLIDDPSTGNGSGGFVDIGAFEYAAPLIVSTLFDEMDGTYGPGDLSLREAIALAAMIPGNDTITFDDDLFASGPQELLVSFSVVQQGSLPFEFAQALTIGSNVTIDGPGADLLKLRANFLNRVFVIQSGVTATIRGMTITEGSASTDPTSRGGAILSEGNLTLDRVAVDYNFAAWSGGGVYSSGDLTIIDSTISNNYSHFSAGAGVGIGGGNAQIINSTISGNQQNVDSFASTGGGIYVSAGSLEVIQSTVTDNEGTSFGGILIGGSGQAFATNSIIGGNRLVTGAASDVSGTLNSSSHHNLIGSGGSGGLTHGVNNNIVLTSGQSVGLSELADFGGPTETHRLLSGSLAIDAGDNAVATAFGLSHDQRGQDRVVDWDGIGGARVDIGAYELAAPIIVNTLQDQNGTDPAKTSLREAIAQGAAADAWVEIQFDPTVFTGSDTITLTHGALPITSVMEIFGTGTHDLTISGDSFSSVVTVAEGVAVTIHNLTIQGGDAEKGGGIYTAGDLKLDRIAIEGNDAGEGAGLYVAGGTVSLTDSSLSSNVADNGGGIYVEDGEVTLRNSTASNNHAGLSGGGIYVESGSLLVLNSTISTNIAQDQGGGIHAADGDLEILSSTITQNKGDEGGAVYIDSDAHVIAQNSILAENYETDGTTPSDVDGLLDINWSLSNLFGSGGSGGQDEENSRSIILDPQESAGLGALADNGGPTLTHALLTNSPAIDWGLLFFDYIDIYDLEFDQRGEDRIVGFGLDLGAYERQVPLTVSTLVDEFDDDHSDGDVSLREALSAALNLPGVDLIRFDDALFSSGPAMITLSFDGQDAGTAPDPLTFNFDLDGVILEGPGAHLLSISGNDQTLVIQVNGNAKATIRDLTIKEGLRGINNIGNLTLERVAVEDNHTTSFAGGIFQNGTSAVLTVIDSTISNNSAGSNAGGIYVTQGVATVINSTISSNTATGPGGGIYVHTGTLNLIQSTVTNNRGSSGGGIYRNTGPVITHNSIIAGNFLSDGTTPSDIFGTVDSGSHHNLIGSGGSGGLSNGVNGNIVLGSGQNAGLSLLGYHGGTTMTHRLLSSSLAIDAGDNAVATAYGLDTDQRGEDRIVDWMEDDLDAIVDIGAVELAFDEIFS